MSDEVRVQDEGVELGIAVKSPKRPRLSWSDAKKATTPEKPKWLDGYVEAPNGRGGSFRKWGGRRWTPGRKNS